MPDLSTIRAPRPATVKVAWGDEVINVTYNRAAFSIALVENVYRMAIRDRVKQVILGWDITLNGEPWQPQPIEHPAWDAVVNARREIQALAERQRAGDNASLSEDERAALQAPTISPAERQSAYEDAWDAYLVQLDREVVRAIDTGVLDDFLGVSWRGATSGNG